MWPFSSRTQKSREERIEQCDHDWNEYKREIGCGEIFRFEDGEPYIEKVYTHGKSCKKCGKVIILEEESERVFFDVTRTEKI